MDGFRLESPEVMLEVPPPVTVMDEAPISYESRLGNRECYGCLSRIFRMIKVTLLQARAERFHSRHMGLLGLGQDGMLT